MVDFPQYRKLDGFHRYYQIIDERTFIEIALMNGKKIVNRIEAKQFPEMLRIQDMLGQVGNYCAMQSDEIDLYFKQPE